MSAKTWKQTITEMLLGKYFLLLFSYQCIHRQYFFAIPFLIHQITVTVRTGYRQPSGLGNYFVGMRFAVQTLLWSLEFVIQVNFEHETIAVWNLARSWSISSFWLILYKKWFWAIKAFRGGHGTPWILLIWVAFISGIKGKLF